MNILENFKTSMSAMSGTSFGLLSLSEYYESQKNKIYSFIGNEKNDATDQVIEWTDDLGEHSVLVSLENYDAMVNNPLMTSLYLDTVSGQYIELTGSRLVKLMPSWPTVIDDSTISDLQCVINHLGENIVAKISAEQYKQCLDEAVDYVDLVINQNNDTIHVSTQSVVSAVENLASEITTQGEFLSYCLNNDKVEAQQFSERVLSGFSNISKLQLDKYTALLNSGDPIQAISGFIETYKNVTYKVNGSGTSEYITVYDRSNYSGVSIANVIFSRVGRFFQVIGDQIVSVMRKFRNVFVSIWNGLKQGAVMLFKLIAGRYFTRFSKSFHSIGIIDCPVMQITLGRLSPNPYGVMHLNINGSILKDVQEALDADGTDYNDTKYNTCCIYGGNVYMELATAINNMLDAPGYYNSGLEDLVLTSICEEIDGNTYVRPLDVFLPAATNPSTGLILRVGPTGSLEEDGYTDIIFQVFPFVPRSLLESCSNDGQVGSLLHEIIAECLAMTDDMFPIMNPKDQNGVVLSPYWSQSNLMTWGSFIMDTIPASMEDNIDLPKLFFYFQDSDWRNKISYISSSHTVRLEMMIMMRIMCCSLLPYFFTCAIDINDISKRYVQWGSNTYLSFSDPNWTEDVDFSDITTMTSVYSPYLQNGLTPVSIHYQTVDDVATEIMVGIGVVALAATAIFVGVKYAKFKRNLVSRAEISQGYCDNMSWNLPQNPSKEELKKYNKAKRKNRKLQRLCNIMGLNSDGSNSTSLSGIIDSIQSQVSSLQGVDYDDPENTPTTTLKDTYGLLMLVKNLLKIN